MAQQRMPEGSGSVYTAYGAVSRYSGDGSSSFEKPRAFSAAGFDEALGLEPFGICIG